MVEICLELSKQIFGCRRGFRYNVRRSNGPTSSSLITVAAYAEPRQQIVESYHPKEKKVHNSLRVMEKMAKDFQRNRGTAVAVPTQLAIVSVRHDARDTDRRICTSFLCTGSTELVSMTGANHRPCGRSQLPFEVRPNGVSGSPYA